MTPFWSAFVVVIGSLATLVTAFQGIRIVIRGKRTTFTANIWNRLTDVEASLVVEKAERQKETSALRAALQQFRDRDGLWLELWHDSNVERTANGISAVPLPEKLRKWPEEISSVT